MAPPSTRPDLRAVGPDEWKDVDPAWQERQRIRAATGPYRQAIGVDLGYSENAGDWASIIPIAVIGRLFYIRDLIRVRRDVIHLRPTLTMITNRYPGAPMVSYIQGPEKAVLALLAEEHIDERTGRRMPPVYIEAMLAKHSKLVRSQRTAEIWNEGRIPVPPNRHWTKEFVERMKRFTGAPGLDDNDTDALVSGIDYLLATGADGGESSTGAYQRTRV